MNCIHCNNAETRVLDSRPTGGRERRKHDPVKVIRRRRECLQCGERFTTYEISLDTACRKKNEQTLDLLLGKSAEQLADMLDGIELIKRSA